MLIDVKAAPALPHLESITSERRRKFRQCLHCEVLQLAYMPAWWRTAGNKTANQGLISLCWCQLMSAWGRAGRCGQKCFHEAIFISVDIDNYHDKCQIIVSFKFKVLLLFLSEIRRNQTVKYVWNHGLCAPVCWTCWLFVVWCKENCRLQLHLVFLRDVSHHIFWEIWVGTCLLLSV